MHPDLLQKIASDVFKATATRVTMLPASGSSRKYYRIEFSDGKTILAAENAEIRENKAFIAFAKHFRTEGLPVPEILHEQPDGRIYFQSDLGNTTLYEFLSENGTESGVVKKLYKKAVDNLLRFQFCTPPDYSLCFPRDRFDRTSMMWDLNYFKYYFLKLAGIPFDEQLLEHDFSLFCDTLAGVPSDFFMYRDFQSRNIMVCEEELSFIDFQGGRRGALQYDVASLLYDAKANLSNEFRNEILEYYCNRLEELHPELSEQFRTYFHHFVLLRIMQAFGAYGYRGYYEKKSHFLQSVPLAAANLRHLLKIIEFGQEFPELEKVWTYISDKFTDSDSEKQENGILQIDLSSFSYRKGYPSGSVDHGGGFVFDCRALPNPGREERFKTHTGKDTDVIGWLDEKEAVSRFIQSCSDLVCLSVDNYLERKFGHLSVAFGCTGGQHRSVYCTEHLAEILEKKYGSRIRILLTHRELS
ncbi:RNase adapter protein RapZ [bioreactor metagenome]|uniref:RNase adapter protein RapZ n=1 Tax=bioreactor metagenome TaxID=1076179 RepID=A0A644XB85_9ZZZZ